MSKFQFSNVVVVDDDQIGVIVKTYSSGKGRFSYDIYVRSYNSIHVYPEGKIKHFVYSKHLADDEYEFYND